ncbi:hypothetical protein GC722_01930 [Auraticoccus sp. F435]|uniref:Uncharacterized protein n=1 Tax=Auraticoccus cholistanensis TaxID=2656650 RepID=A0A6A9UQG3_9ACTN|nr:hypothetical protein [Auraticoccus cholistanensis]MVA74798.1 hypothetical protein [Auraticoccus cholistanensis]
MSTTPGPQHPPRPQHRPPGAPGPAPARPSSVRNAVALIWVGAGLSLLGLVAALAQQGQTRAMVAEELARQGLQASPELIDTTVTLGLVTAVVSGLVVTALWALNAVFCGRGANWSRILATVLGGLYLVSGVLSLTQPTPWFSKALVVATMLVTVGALVLLWTRSSSEWFRAVGARPGPTRYGPAPGPA